MFFFMISSCIAYRKTVAKGNFRKKHKLHCVHVTIQVNLERKYLFSTNCNKCGMTTGQVAVSPVRWEEVVKSSSSSKKVQSANRSRLTKMLDRVEKKNPKTEATVKKNGLF